MAEVENTGSAMEEATLPERPAGRTVALPWDRLLLGAILALSGLLNFVQLGRLGYGNSYYAAAVRSMMQNWHNFFFASFDPGGFVTIDKPPLGFWLQVISAKLFGYSGVSLLLPSALAGVLSVWLLYYLVNRRFGQGAGLLAALALAVTPVAIASNRSNIIDSILVLFLLLGAWAAGLAAERGSLRWLLLCAVFVGLGFNVKMLEAYLVVPAFGLTYLLGAPRGWWVRFGHLLLAAAVLAAVSLSWAVAVDLTPASARPWVDSTTTNSEVDLAIGYNGLQRLTGQNRGGRGVFNRTRPDRTGNGSQVGGTAAPGVALPQGLPPALADMARAFSSGGRGGPGGMFDNGAAGPLRLLGQSLGGQDGWLLPLAVLGLLAAVARRRPRFPLDDRERSLVLWGAWLITAGGFFSVASFFHSYYLVTLAPAIAALAGIGALALWRDYARRGRRGWLLPLVLLVTAGVQISLLQPYPGWNRWLDPLIGIVAVAGAAVLLLGRLPRSGRLRHALRLWTPAAAALTVLSLLAAPTAWSVYTTTQGGGGMTPAAGPAAAGDRGFSFGGGRGAGSFGGDSGSSGLLQYLEAHQGRTTYLVAVSNSNSASSLIIQSGKPVMSLGGFGGNDPILTLAQFQHLVLNNTVRYSMGGGGGFGGRGGGTSQISQWVQSACKAVDASAYAGGTGSQTMSGGGTGAANGRQGGFGAVGAQSGAPLAGAASGTFAGGGFGGGFGQQLYDCAGAAS